MNVQTNQDLLDTQPLSIPQLTEEEYFLNKAIFITLTTGIGLTEFEKIYAEFGHMFSNILGSYYEVAGKLLIDVLNLGVQSCEKSLRFPNSQKIVGIDGAWNAPRDANFCVVDLIYCETRKLIVFQIVTNIDLYITHPNLTYTQDPPNPF